jgi:3-oxoacyl-[acyl-carrier-protein] synthase-3
MYVPSRVVTNEELAGMLDTSDKWIRQRVGISERRVSTTETAAEMGYRAALQAIENSGCKAEEIDLILSATVSGEDTAPSVSCTIQKLLGVNCVALDINAACSAFLFLLEIAAGYFARGTVKKVLVVGAERMSRVIDWQDRSTCVIFGDGAGAVVLEAGDNYLASLHRARRRRYHPYPERPRQLALFPAGDAAALYPDEGAGDLQIRGERHLLRYTFASGEERPKPFGHRMDRAAPGECAHH